INYSLNVSESKGIIQSAMSCNYKAPNKEHIQTIVETWTNETYDLNDNYFQTFYKHKKERAERTRSHYDERVQDVITYFESNTDKESIYIKGQTTEALDHSMKPNPT